jgi:hypothetical protein
MLAIGSLLLTRHRDDERHARPRPYRAPRRADAR